MGGSLRARRANSLRTTRGAHAADQHRKEQQYDEAVLSGVNDVADVREQVLTILGQAQVVGRAVEQPNLEVLLQLPDQAGVTAEGVVLLSRATAENEPVSVMRMKVPRARSRSMIGAI